MKSHKPSASWMGNPETSPREFITLADVIGTSGYSNPGNTDNTITLTLGVGYSGETYTQDALIFSPPGILSIPLGPGSFDSSGNFNASNTSPTGTQALAYLRNDQWIVLGVRDTRTQLLAGTLNPGETCIYSPVSQGRILLKNDGSITAYTATSSSATAMCLSMNPATDTISLVNSKGYGIIISDSGVTLTTGSNNPGGSTVQLNGTDGSINITATGQLAMDGTAINVGYQLGATILTNAALVGPTGLTAVPSTKVLIAIE